MPAAARQLNIAAALPTGELRRASAARRVVTDLRVRLAENARYDRQAEEAREQELVERGLAC